MNNIIYEDDFVLLMNKPSGLMVEPDRNGYPNLLQQVRQYIKQSNQSGGEVYAQHINRLDRPVSGIVLFAKQKSVLRNLSEQFAQRKVKKKYRALTVAAPEKMEGVLEQWHRKEKKKAIIVKEGMLGAELIKLSYKVSVFSEGVFLWDIDLYTGKYHQIRIQFSHLGCPIIGDALYGSERSYLPNSIALHAYQLEFTHPVTNEKMLIQSEPVWGIT
jgi:RluA family pseudouridine synthase